MIVCYFYISCQIHLVYPAWGSSQPNGKYTAFYLQTTPTSLAFVMVESSSVWQRNTLPLAAGLVEQDDNKDRKRKHLRANLINLHLQELEKALI